MTLLRPARVLFLLAPLFALASCASTPDRIRSDAAHNIEPIREAPSTARTGWLVASVEGNPRDIQYYLNGVRLETDEPIEWWKDAALRLQLRPGFYDLEARYRVRAFAGRGIEYRIVTRYPVEVVGGVETLVEANLEKDWRGVPAAETAYFVPLTAERRQRKQAAQEQAALSATAPLQSGETAAGVTAGAAAAATTLRIGPEGAEDLVPPNVDLQGAAPPTDQIVIHGNGTRSGTGSVSIQNAEGTSPRPSAADNIVIHGPGSVASSPGAVTSGASGSAALPAAAAVGAAAVTGAALSAGEPEPSAPFLLEGAEDFGITVTIQSIPSGARVTIDEQFVGETPVRVRMDPRADHVVEFAHDGCGDHVRLLSSNSWREGRDTKVQVQLYCD